MDKVRLVENEAIILLEDTYEESLLHLPRANPIRFRFHGSEGVEPRGEARR